MADPFLLEVDMTKGWRVIDCTAMTGRLTYKRGQLVVEHHDTETRIPLVDTAVLLLGMQTTVSTALLQQLAVFDVEVLICQWNEIPIAALQPWNKPNTRSAARQTAQQEMSIPTRKAAWKQIIQAKILGQSHVLDMLELDGGQLLRSLATQVRSGDPNNIEGQAAREYWHHMFPEEQFRRFPGYGEGRNTQLDYAYTILRGFLIKSICTAGLSPTIGIHHHSASNYFCLADDLIEPFRPAIDYGISQLPDEPLDSEIKQQIVFVVNSQFNPKGLTIPSLADEFCGQYAQYCEGWLDKLPVPVFGKGEKNGKR